MLLVLIMSVTFMSRAMQVSRCAGAALAEPSQPDAERRVRRFSRVSLERR